MFHNLGGNRNAQYTSFPTQYLGPLISLVSAFPAWADGRPPENQWQLTVGGGAIYMPKFRGYVGWRGIYANVFWRRFRPKRTIGIARV